MADSMHVHYCALYLFPTLGKENKRMNGTGFDTGVYSTWCLSLMYTLTFLQSLSFCHYGDPTMLEIIRQRVISKHTAWAPITGTAVSTQVFSF